MIAVGAKKKMETDCLWYVYSPVFGKADRENA